MLHCSRNTSFEIIMKSWFIGFFPAIVFIIPNVLSLADSQYAIYSTKSSLDLFYSSSILQELKDIKPYCKCDNIKNISISATNDLDLLYLADVGRSCGCSVVTPEPKKMVYKVKLLLLIEHQMNSKTNSM